MSVNANKKIKLTLPLIPGVLDDDVQVILNGKVYIIKRGNEVEVPVAVKEILDNQTAQARKVAKIIDEQGKGING